MRMDSFFFFFFNDTATTEIYTLSLHDALPISSAGNMKRTWVEWQPRNWMDCTQGEGREFLRKATQVKNRSEEHTSELQSRLHLVCRLLLEKKKKYGDYQLDQLNRTDS